MTGRAIRLLRRSAVVGLVALVAGAGPAIGDAPSLPPALPDPTPASANRPIGEPLIPGQAIEPIALPGALRRAGARALDIPLARERVCQAVAALDQARVLWLPSLYVGPSWIRHDGQ